jgi:hypothetical protein
MGCKLSVVNPEKYNSLTASDRLLLAFTAGTGSVQA